jgi:hypothetical protein
MEEEKEFDYSDFWSQEEKKEKKKIEKEMANLPKGTPRKGIKGRYIKPKNYVSRRSSLSTMKSFVWQEKQVE